MSRAPSVRRQLTAPHGDVTPASLRGLRAKLTALREQGGRRSSGAGSERAGRDELRLTRRDQSDADGDEPDRIRNAGVDGGDGAGDEQDDVVVVVVIVETGNPRRVRRAGVGEGRKREQGAQEEARKQRPAFHGPETIRQWDIGRKWPE